MRKMFLILWTFLSLSVASCLPEDERDLGFDIDVPAGTCGELDEDACSAEYLGAFEPLESSYEAIPYGRAGTQYTFSNAAGRSVTMKVKANVDFYRLRTSQRLNACNLPGMHIQSCRDVFSQEVRLDIDELGYRFIVTLSPRVYNLSDQNELIVLDMLEIDRIEDVPLMRNGQFEFEVNRQRDSEMTTVLLYPRTNYDSISFNGENYEDVITSDPNIYLGRLPLFKFYYNYNQGIVAFIDAEGETWNLMT
ncbi:hypothetical protein [Neolewinella persica]|uniref:hypothetical protein n=1 Tax=Neolewinella persica TaxID=70998 RepID=UPI000366B1FE|nr:hypothetical protein [Neolewinella persica]